jgi:glyoxylase-like metal-dependent hydrolase (beta-lactamase superfamily II)
MSEEYPEPERDVPGLAPARVAERLRAREPVRLLDVRDRDEIERWRIEGPSVTATHVPYAKFMAARVHGEVGDLADEIAGEGPVTVVCGRGEASAYVAGLLLDAGVEARNLAGGMDAWGRVYEAREVAVEAEATVLQYDRPATGCLSYLVASEGAALVVDPLRTFAERYRADAEEHGAELTAVFDTHLHADHVSGLRALTTACEPTAGPRRLAPAGIDARNLTYGVEPVADGETVTVGATAVEAVALPGHTTEMTGLLVGDCLLAGDSVFLDSVARPDLQEGVDHRELARELYRTVTERLPALGDPLVAPGHRRTETEPAGDGTDTARLSTVRERVGAVDDEAAFVDRVLAERPRPANVERILAVNRGTETADAATAFELELGPNNCAAA